MGGSVSKKKDIRINVVRGDGEVTQLKGESGMAVCMGAIAAKVRESEPPAVSLRCSTEAELAWNLAALMGAVRAVSPHAFEVAHELMEFCDFKRPLVNRMLP